MVDPAATDIFVSYSQHDKRWVKRLVESLVALRGWSVWWDQAIRTGEPFDRRIESQVAAARCVLVVWSERSVESEWVRAEATEGWERGVLLPVLLDVCQPPMPFRQTQAADLAAWSGRADETAFRKLLIDIANVVDRGGDAPASLRAERASRRKQVARRKRLRHIAFAAATVVLLTAGWGAHYARQAQTRSAEISRSLATRAVQLRESAMRRSHDEAESFWPYVLSRGGRFDQLQLATLLALEAHRAAPTATAQRALRDALALLVVPKLTLPTTLGRVESLSFSADGKLLAAKATDRTEIWNLDSRDTVLTRSFNAPYAFHPEMAHLAIASEQTGLQLLDTSTMREIKSFDVGAKVTSVAYSADGHRLVVGSADRQVRIFDSASTRSLAHLKHTARIVSVSLSKTAKYGAWVDESGVGQIFAGDSAKPVGQRLKVDSMTRLIFSPDETLVATDGWVSVFELPTGKLRYELIRPTSLEGQYFPVYGSPVFATDGKSLLVRSREVLIWWDIAEKKIVFERWHTSYVTGLALSRDGSFAATSSADMTSRVWLHKNGHEIARFARPWRSGSGAMDAVTINPDASLIASATRGHSIDLWEVWPADPVAAACQRLVRNLTRFEWIAYLGDAPYRLTCPNLDSRGG